MENQKHLKDQLCHIFKFRASTFCLICKTVISDAVSLNVRKDSILNHLGSSEHKESNRALFKMCIPDPACDSDCGKYLDIVTRSVFDISVMLGEETSYICQRGDKLVCLMCKTSIAEMTPSFSEIIFSIAEHLESDVHTQSVKEVCWYYRLNSKKDYLLLYKSIWHCSVCEETMNCEEIELVQSAVNHVESNNHEQRKNLENLNVEKAKINSNRLNSLEDKFTFNFITPNVTNDVLLQPIKVEPYERELFTSRNQEVMDSAETILSEDVKNQLENIPLKRQENQMLSSTTTEEQSLHENRRIPVNNRLPKTFLEGSCQFILENSKFLEYNGKRVFCMLCNKTIFFNDNKSQFESQLLSHLRGSKHTKNVDNISGFDAKLRTGLESNVDCERQYSNELNTVGKTRHWNNLVFLAGSSSSMMKKQIDNDSNRMSTDHPESFDDKCTHRGNKVFGSCIICLRRILTRVCPGMIATQFILTGNILKCMQCNSALCTTRLSSLIAYCVNHYELHIQNRAKEAKKLKSRTQSTYYWKNRKEKRDKKKKTEN